MPAEQVRADALEVGDLITWLGDRWYVMALFVDGSENTMSIDLLRDDDTESGGCHVSTDHMIERVQRATA
jgi:hypothetical protein